MIRSTRARSYFALISCGLLLSTCSVEDLSLPPAASTQVQLTRSATLATCPRNLTTSAEATIGPDGGVLALEGSRILIPAGAVREPTRFNLTIPSGRHMRVDITARGSDHFVFARPVALTISYARCRRPPGMGRSARVWYIHGTSHELLADLGGRDDPLASTVEITIGHLSTYAVAY